MKHLQNTTIIYIPGLFDRVGWVEALQRRALKSWSKYGGNPEMFTIGWSDEGEFDPRLEELCDRIEQLRAQGRSVALVGASAGASAVVGALARLGTDISASVLICGKIHRPHIIPEVVYDLNEVFEDALDDVSDDIEQLSPEVLSRMVSLRSFKDGIVPPRDSVIQGAKNVRMPVIGHIAGIGFALLRYGRFVVRFCINGEVNQHNQPVAD